jgi:hypothetical protein
LVRRDGDMMTRLNTAVFATHSFCRLSFLYAYFIFSASVSFGFSGCTEGDVES